MVNKEQLLDVFKIHYPHFSDIEIENCYQLFEVREFKKGEVIISNKGMCTSCHFLLEGYTRCYTIDEDNETTLWFGEKGDLITSFQSLLENKQSSDIIVALTNCKTFCIPMDKFKQLSLNNQEFNRLYIKIIEMGYQFWENRFRILSQLDVEKRYLEWRGRTKHLEEFVPLGVIAQYLNINQATLSRIRSKKR